MSHLHRALVIGAFAAMASLAGACAVPSLDTDGHASPRPAPAPSSEAPQVMLFTTTSSTSDPHRAVLTFDFAVIARQKGHDVSVFLAGDATLLMKEKVRSEIRAPGQPAAMELVAKARDLGIPVYV